MIEGGMDVTFMIVYFGQGTLRPADVLALHKKNLRIAVIGVENGYSIGTDLKRVEEFYDRGGRYMSLAHIGNSQLPIRIRKKPKDTSTILDCRRRAGK